MLWRCTSQWGRRSLILIFPRRSSTGTSTSGRLVRPEAKKERKLHPMTAVPVVCFVLGTWQVFRRKGKLKLIEEIEERRVRPPVEFNGGEEYLEYTRVKVTGTYDYSHEFFIGPRHDVIEHGERGEAGGYHSVVPMVTTAGERILIDRGWVKNKTDEPSGQLAGEVEVEGYIRHAEPPILPLFAPEPGSSNTYIWRDTPTMAELSNTLPITIELSGKHTVKDGPIAGQTKLVLSNRHAEYIATYYILGALALLYMVNYRKKPKSVPKVFR